MNVSIKLEDEARQTYAVFVDGVCIARTLPMAEAKYASEEDRGIRPRASMGSWLTLVQV